MSHQNTDTTPDWMRPLRYIWRVPKLAVHVLLFLPPVVILISVGRNRLDAQGETLSARAIRWWSSHLLRVFGIVSRHQGSPANDPVLFVANHASWLDIQVIHSQRAAGFVGKAEIARWPMIGYLAKIGGTVFHHRGSGHSQAQVTAAMTERLRSGGSVAIFPEGRTGRGIPVLPFHGRLLQAAIEADAVIQPIAIRFDRGGRYNHAVAFRPAETFVGNLFRLLGEPRSYADVHFLDPIYPGNLGRRDIAHQARASIVEIVEADA